MSVCIGLRSASASYVLGTVQVQEWLGTARNVEVIDALAHVLVQERVIDAQRWAALVRQYTVLEKRTAIKPLPPVARQPSTLAPARPARSQADGPLSAWDFDHFRWTGKPRRLVDRAMSPNATGRTGGVFVSATC